MTHLMTCASAQQKPTMGYATVSGLKVYYEFHSSDKQGFGNGGELVVLLSRFVPTIRDSLPFPTSLPLPRSAGQVGRICETA